MDYQICSSCGGKGRLREVICPRCEGLGKAQIPPKPHTTKKERRARG